jgi:intracellular septation protein
MMKEMNPSKAPPAHIIKQLEAHLAYFLMVYGIFMGALALWGTTSHWTFFKTVGFYIIFFVFFIVEMFIMRKKHKKMLESEQSSTHSKEL